ncbi:MAG: NAD-dependent epimerase/dehydratase family protein [Acholeplasmataceae bacterium]|nr:NAD-dependent epimerase/dehydratase family protein [Acholeplasmataceae bacterium]MCK9427978.1 NAD-dependent epimerase/dehydratase family protein [Acholeplasmataceae bacterium]
MMTEFIITGATGFIGRVLVNDLLDLDYENIKVVSRKANNLEIFKGKKLKSIVGDINDKKFLRTIITNNSVVFHLAGIVDIKSKKDDLVYQVNYQGTKNIIDVCLEKDVKKLIYSSSSSAININSKKQEIKEPKEFNVKKLVGDYAKSKALATAYLFSKIKEGLKAVVLYPTAVFGPYDYHISKITEVLVDYYHKKRFFYLKGCYNFVDVRDVSKALIKAYLKGHIGEGYLIGGNKVTLKEMFVIINGIMGKKKMPIKIPLFIVKLFLPFLEFAYLIRKKTPIFSRTSLKALTENCNFNIEKAYSELDYQPRPIEESFSDTINWLKENNYLKIS